MNEVVGGSRKWAEGVTEEQRGWIGMKQETNERKGGRGIRLGWRNSLGFVRRQTDVVGARLLHETERSCEERFTAGRG